MGSLTINYHMYFLSKVNLQKNFFILVSPGGTTIVCTGEKVLKIQVPRLAKMGFLTHFLL